MQDVDVVYLVEHIARELDVACAVKHYSGQRHQLRVEVVPIKSPSDALSTFRPRVVALPYSYRATDPETRNYLPHWPKAIYFNLSWEQLLYRAFQEEKAPSDEFSCQYVLHHAWGNFHKDYLMRHRVPESHVFVNGQPAYKLYDDPYCLCQAQRPELARRFGLDPDKRWIFFPENYGWAFYTEAKLNEIISRGLDRRIAYEQRDFCRKSLPVVLKWCADVASRGAVEVVVRPRPATLLSAFRSMVSHALDSWPANLHIIKEGSVREWVLASDTVLSSYSTTLIEAAVAGKCAYMVLPYPLPEGLMADWYANAAQLRTWDEFESACCQEPDASSSEPLKQWARREMMSRGDAIRNLADILAEIARPGFDRPPEIPPHLIPEPQDKSQHNEPPERTRPIAEHAYRLMRKCAGTAWKRWKRAAIPGWDWETDKTAVSQSDLERFDQDEVGSRVAEWEKVLS